MDFIIDMDKRTTLNNKKVIDKGNNIKIENNEETKLVKINFNTATNIVKNNTNRHLPT